MWSLSALIVVLLQLQLGSARVFERCELAAQLKQRYGLTSHQVATLVCIAQHSSDLNTAAFGGGSGPGGGSHGIFQISDVYWCSPPGQGTGCGVSCARLRDDDIGDDVACVRKIYAEHQRLSGDGFTAWQAYGAYCRQDAAAYVAGCGLPVSGHNSILQVAASYQQPQQVSYQQALAPVHHHHQHQHHQQTQGKIYSRCELAQELFYQHKLPMQQIPTWVCIAQHESSYNTAAVGRLNADGSADHGLFQISDLFWCTHDQRGGKGCHASCNQFLDSSISDDVQCIRRIHQEHTQISGDGFTAWTVYNRDCRNQRYEQVAACFAKPPLVAPATHPNAIGGTVSKVSYAYQLGQPQLLATTPNPYYRPTSKLVSYQPAVQSTAHYQGNPFLRPRLPPPPPPPPPPPAHIQVHPNAIGLPTKTHYYSSPANPFAGYKQHTTHKQHYQHQQQQHYYTTPTRAGKVYKRCELAQELYFSHKFPMQDIATWVCIAEHESRFDTSAVGRLNADGSADHGLFQISDLYWCTHDQGSGGKGCHIGCDRLLNADITDDVQCIRTIHEEHTRISGDGFTAWTVYNGHCRDRRQAEIASCFEPSELEKETVKPAKPTSQGVVSKPSKPKGKIYNRCELAQELYHKHQLPMHEIPTWVCIAQHESSYNTAAVGRLNGDGSEDHGLFQISDLYWCTHGDGGGKACNIECDRLLDSDITDDVQCIRTIHEEHTRLSGDGFTAWTVYNGHCKQQSLAQLSDCFSGNEIAEAEQQQHQHLHDHHHHHDERPQVPAAQQHSDVRIVHSHAYSNNPFLQGFSASQATQTVVKAIKTTPKPSTFVAVTSSQTYASNPFLQHVKPQQQPTIVKPKDKPLKFVEHEPPSKSDYQHNPFLNKAGIASIEPTTQNKQIHLNNGPAYASNPFLSHLNRPTTIAKPPATTTTAKPTVAIKTTQHSYVNSDIFRKEIVKFTATSTAATTVKHVHTSSSTTPTTTRPTTHPTTTATTRSTTTTRHPATTHSPITWISTAKSPTFSKSTITTKHTTSKATTTTTRPSTRATTKQTTTSRTTTRYTTTQANRYTTTATTSTRPITTRATPSTNPTTNRSTTRNPATTRATSPTTTRSTTIYPTTRSTAYPTTTTRFTTRPTTKATAQSTTRYSTVTTTRPTATHASTRRSTTTHRTTTRPAATRPTTRLTTTRPTTTHPTTTHPTSTRPTATHRTTARPTAARTTTTRATTTGATAKPTTRLSTTTTTATRRTTRSTTLSTTSTTTRNPTIRSTTTTGSTTTTRPTTKSTTRSTTTWHPFISSWLATTTTRHPTTTTTYTARPKPTTTSKTTTRTPTTTRPFSTTHSPPMHAAIRVTTSTTPRPYLFTSTTRPTKTTATTTRRLTTTTTTNASKSTTTMDPFSHPFFAKFKAKFESNRSTTKPTTTTPSSNYQSKFTASPYYAKFQENSAKVAAKTVYVYDFDQNRTTTTTLRPNPTVHTTLRN